MHLFEALAEIYVDKHSDIPDVCQFWNQFGSERFTGCRDSYSKRDAILPHRFGKPGGISWRTPRHPQCWELRERYDPLFCEFEDVEKNV